MFVYYKCYIMIELMFLSDNCHYWYFLSYSFKFQSNVCNRSHDLLMMSINHSNIVILNIEDSDYHCIISLITKNEFINLLQHDDLTEKSGTLFKKWKIMD